MYDMPYLCSPSTFRAGRTRPSIKHFPPGFVVLGVMYSTGREKRLDLVQAHVWYSMAQHHGREHVEDLLVELERGMATGQVAEA